MSQNISDLVEQFQSITGLSMEESKEYIEMTGYDLQIALSLYFENGPQDQHAEHENECINGNDISNEILIQTETSIHNLLWPENGTDINKAWVNQGFQVDSKCGLGFIQHENGPCGPLATVNAIIISQVMLKPDFSLSYIITDEDIANALLDILYLNNTNNQIQIGFYAFQNNFVQVNFEIFDIKQDAFDYIFSNIDMFKSKGGLVLFLYSLIQTRGVETIKQQISSSNGELPLIFPPHYYSGTELIMLMLRGVADGNVGNFSGENSEQCILDNPLNIGLLSSQSIDQGIPVNDVFLTPKSNVWILHSGQHYTFMFALENITNETKQFNLYHYNGLKPGGPRLATIKLSAIGGMLVKNLEPKIYQKLNDYYLPEKGEIDIIVQALDQYKKKYPQDYTKWVYEVALADGNSKGNGKKRPEDIPAPKKFEQGINQEGPWRCLKCFDKRYETMCFGQNDAGQQCKYCRGDKEQCGWTILLSYDELPRENQRSIQRQHGARILSILDTKWPYCQVEFLDQDYPPSV